MNQTKTTTTENPHLISWQGIHSIHSTGNNFFEFFFLYFDEKNVVFEWKRVGEQER